MNKIEKIKSKIITFLFDKGFRIAILFSNERLSKMIFLSKNKSVRYLFSEQISVSATFDLLRRIYATSDKKTRKKLIECFFVNQYILGKKIREKYQTKTNIPVPVNLLISVTNKCNLSCKYCYGPKGKNIIELPIDVLDRIVSEGKSLGVYWNVISGGEPFLRNDLLELFKKHSDTAFTVFTNGLSMTEDLAKELSRLGNVMPAISIEGYKEKTDSRRGKDVYDKIMLSMDLLKKYKVPFAYSITVTKYNVNEVSSEDFIKMLISKGAILGFYLPYIPTGEYININNLIPPKRKALLGKQLSDLRKRLPIFIDDFQHKNQGRFGCKGIWGSHLHINVHGDITPCISTNFASDNIKNTTLKKALRSDFLMNIRNIGSMKNGSKPCLILHNPKVLEKIIKKSNAYPTEPNAEKIYTKFADIAKEYSKKYEKELLK